MLTVARLLTLAADLADTDEGRPHLNFGLVDGLLEVAALREDPDLTDQQLKHLKGGAITTLSLHLVQDLNARDHNRVRLTVARWLDDASGDAARQALRDARLILAEVFR